MLFGSTFPRIFTAPLVTGPPGPCGCGCALTPETSHGFNAIDFCEQIIGVKLLPWQRWLFIHALELNSDDTFRYSTILIMIARQNGKTTWVEFKNLWKMFALKVQLVIGTAQNLDLAEESWSKAVEIAEGVDDLAGEIKSVFKGNGKKVLTLHSGARWKIAAASRSGGRGLSGDDVNLDELREHLDWNAWGAVTKTTLARSNSQVYAYSNAGDERSLPLNALQETGRALAQQKLPQDKTIGHFEWSVPDNVRCTCGRIDGKPHSPTCRLQDRALWAMANPSLGYRITEAKIASALTTDPTAVFLTEVLCQRVPSLTRETVISVEEWDSIRVRAEDASDVAYAAGMSRDRKHGVIAACRKRTDGRLQVSIVDYRSGTAWMTQRLADLIREQDPVGVGIQDRGHTSTLILPLAEELYGEGATLDDLVDDRDDEPVRGRVVCAHSGDVATAYGLFVDAVRQGTVTHVDDAPLNKAVAVAESRPLGTGSAWEVRTDEADVSPLPAATEAYWIYVTRAHLVKTERDPVGVW